MSHSSKIELKNLGRTLGWFKNPVSSQTDKLMAGTKYSDYLGLNHYEIFHSFKVD